MLEEDWPMSSSAPINSTSAYVNTSLYFPDDFNEFRVIFIQDRQRIAYAINVRDIGIFDTTPTLSGEQWPDPSNAQNTKQPYRKMFFFSDASLNFAHGISGLVSCTHIYGTATDGTNFFPIPFVSTTAIANQIQLLVTPTNIVVTKGGGAPAITSGTIVLEYLLN